jgi:hypothetical protein
MLEVDGRHLLAAQEIAGEQPAVAAITLSSVSTRIGTLTPKARMLSTRR